MKNTNIDGIRVIRKTAQLTSVTKLAVRRRRSFNFSKFPIIVSAILLLIGFGGGAWFTMQTSQSDAERPQVLGATTAYIPLTLAPTSIKQLSNDVLFNMPIEQLEVQINKITEDNIQQSKEQLLKERKEKLTQYLKEKKSPFVSIVDTLVQLKHWKLVLAISNSESTLGKRCYSNNCSGIGVEPGHPLWRSYASTAEWAKDLDKLLEQRYKDWTLEKMNGVYNKPGSRNWLLASKQILEELEELNIK